MLKLSLSELQKSKSLPEGELVLVYETEKTQLIGKPKTYWCLAVRIKKQVYASDFWSDEGSNIRSALDKAMRQLSFILHAGWYNTGETRLDDMNLFREPLYRCAYCNTESIKIKGKCSCRKELAKAKHG